MYKTKVRLAVMGKILKDTHKRENWGINHLMRHVIGQSLGGMNIVTGISSYGFF